MTKARDFFRAFFLVPQGENAADLSRKLNPKKYQHLVLCSPQAVHFPG
jgi:hypothetical protein